MGIGAAFKFIRRMAFKDHPLIGFGPLDTHQMGYIHAGACGSGLDEAWPMDCPRHSPERSRGPEPFRRREDLSQALVFYRGDSRSGPLRCGNVYFNNGSIQNAHCHSRFSLWLEIEHFRTQCRQILGDEFDPRGLRYFPAPR